MVTTLNVRSVGLFLPHKSTCVVCLYQISFYWHKPMGLPSRCSRRQRGGGFCEFLSVSRSLHHRPSPVHSLLSVSDEGRTRRGAWECSAAWKPSCVICSKVQFLKSIFSFCLEVTQQLLAFTYLLHQQLSPCWL